MESKCFLSSLVAGVPRDSLSVCSFVICYLSGFFILKTYFQYVGKKVSCTSSNQKEGKLAFYSEGDVTAYLANPSDASKLGEKKALKDGVSLLLDNCQRDTC